MAQTKEEKRAYMKVWNAENRSTIREKARARYQKDGAHRAYVLAASSRYTETTRGRARQLLMSARLRAKATGQLFTITEEWVTERLERGVCPMTGIPFVMTRGEGRQAYAPSLDRIDPSVGYTPENARLIISAVNLAKNVWSDDTLYEWAEALLAHRQHESAH